MFGGADVGVDGVAGVAVGDDVAAVVAVVAVAAVGDDVVCGGC